MFPLPVTVAHLRRHFPQSWRHFGTKERIPFHHPVGQIRILGCEVMRRPTDMLQADLEALLLNSARFNGDDLIGKHPTLSRFFAFVFSEHLVFKDHTNSFRYLN